MIATEDVRKTLARHLLTEGFDLVVDLEKSRGSRLADKRTGDSFLDFFSMYASMSVGFNHPQLVAVRDQLGALAIQKTSNSDMYTEALAAFVETFSRLGIPAHLPHAFFIEGGALAVENALKAAFDWKVRKNFARGHTDEKGSKIIHFQQAFHGRSGYTLSLTNTFDPRKTKYYPKFDWPRVVNPKIEFPLEGERLARVEAVEAQAIAEIESAIARDGAEMAGLIIEPIQGEGGDNHFRPEFFQTLRRLCDEHELLLILDEIQTGVGLTGKFWAHEHFGIKPDLLCFGKKTQVCGILTSRRIDEVPRHVFQEPSRIGSTFSGNLIDMVRFTHILRIIEAEKLVENARVQGALLLREIETLAEAFPEQVSNVRGRGLMCAFDLPDRETRDRLARRLFQERLLIIGCGEKSIRFRPHLIVSPEEILEGVSVIRKALANL
jgi:L-lysine 6-transaminase